MALCRVHTSAKGHYVALEKNVCVYINIYVIYIYNNGEERSAPVIIFFIKIRPFFSQC